MIFVYIFQQLLTELPSNIVCVVAIVLAFTFHQRAPSATVYVIVACGLTLLLPFLHLMALQVVHLMFDSQPDTVRRIDMGFPIFWSLMRAISIGLLVGAVYTGRKRA
jgi:hypothetical protein